VNNAQGVPAWINEESKPTEVGAPVLRDPAVVVLTRYALCFPRPVKSSLACEVAAYFTGLGL
jgi:hypothetical protein